MPTFSQPRPFFSYSLVILGHATDAPLHMQVINHDHLTVIITHAIGDFFTRRSTDTTNPAAAETLESKQPHTVAPLSTSLHSLLSLTSRHTIATASTLDDWDINTNPLSPQDRHHQHHTALATALNSTSSYLHYLMTQA